MMVAHIWWISHINHSSNNNNNNNHDEDDDDDDDDDDDLVVMIVMMIIVVITIMIVSSMEWKKKSPNDEVNQVGIAGPFRIDAACCLLAWLSMHQISTHPASGYFETIRTICLSKAFSWQGIRHQNLLCIPRP